jgi:hypothetical protein
MRRLLVMMLLALSAVGCGQLRLPKVILVHPLSEQDLLDAKAAVLIHANSADEQASIEDADSSKGCLCGGTGRSGDGLGPCACPDGCTCKKRGDALEAATAEPEPEPVEEVSASGQVEAAAESEYEPDPLAVLEQQVAKVRELNKGLADASVTLASKSSRLQTDVQSLDARVAALEAAKQSATPTTASKTEQDPNRQLVILYAEKDLQAIDKWETEQGSKLVDVGWTIGNDASYQIVKLRVESQDAAEYPQALEAAGKYGTPYWAACYEKRLKRAAQGLPGATQVAAVLNETTASTTKSGGQDSWASIPETWPARVPISGTTTPSKETLIWHLRGGGTGGGSHRNDFVGWPLEQMTAGQLVTLHDGDHPEKVTTQSRSSTVVRKQVLQAPMIQQPVQMIRRGSGTVSYRARTCVNGKCF